MSTNSKNNPPPPHLLQSTTTTTTSSGGGKSGLGRSAPIRTVPHVVSGGIAPPPLAVPQYSHVAPTSSSSSRQSNNKSSSASGGNGSRPVGTVQSPRGSSQHPNQQIWGATLTKIRINKINYPIWELFILRLTSPEEILTLALKRSSSAQSKAPPVC